MTADRSRVHEFVSEAKEHLANIGDDLLGLEHAVGDAARARVDSLFRAVHSVKSAAGFFGCAAVEQLAHVMETVLDSYRRQSETPGPPVIDALLGGADRILVLLDDVEHSSAADVSDVLARLRQFVPADKPPQVPTQSADPDWPVAPLERPPGHRFLYGVRVELAASHRRGQMPLAVLQQVQAAGTILDARLQVPETDLSATLPAGPVWYQALVSSPLDRAAFRQALNLEAAEVIAVEQPAVEEPPPAASPAPPSPEPARSSSVRIPVELVDRLLTLAGELVLVRNQALRTTDGTDATLRPIVQRLDAVTSELQDAVMQTRMQPVGNLFGKFPRMVRDLARQLGKQIELEVSGTEVELDKTILEALSDPLTHLVRNSCDHGLERPDERLHAGKPASGHVQLSARSVGGQIVIQVRDDGRGLDLDAIRRKALERGLRTQTELARLSDRELCGLILLPGFSTAREVTDVSGRGVGMDVVKTNLDHLGGVLEIDSVRGQGVTFTLRLPLTLAIIPCLLVTANGGRYAIPQKDVEQLVCLHGAQASSRIEYALDQEVIRHRGRLLPLVRLDELLRRPVPFTATTRSEIVGSHRNRSADAVLSTQYSVLSTQRRLSIAVLKWGSRRFGLVIEQILSTEEVVVKPMHSALGRLAIYSGATILGDGQIALILGPAGLAQHAGVRFDESDETQPARTAPVWENEKQTVLLFRCGPSEQFAVPLPMVRRVVQVRPEQIERIGEREFMTVENVPTAVLRLDRVLGVTPCAERSSMFLLLPRHVQRPLGILLSELLDTETLAVAVHSDAYRAEGVVGSAVVHGRLTLFLDVQRLAAQLETNGRAPALLPMPAPRRVLLVEDTQFFQQLVRGYLESDGYHVVLAADGNVALEELAKQSFDLVVSDIEMPGMDGWTLAQAIRRRPGLAALPLLALTTLDNDEARARSLASGFQEHEVKIDRERFLKAVARLLHRARTAAETTA